MPGDRCGEGGALHESGGEPKRGGVDFAVDDGCGVEAVYPSCGGDFAAEAAPEVWVVRQLGADRLDGHRPPGQGVGEVDLAHTARAEACRQGVVPQLCGIVRLKCLKDRYLRVRARARFLFGHTAWSSHVINSPAVPYT